MAVVTSDFLAGVLTNFRSIYASSFQAALAAQGWQDISLRVPSNGEQNSYSWFGTVPTMEDVTHGIASRNGLPKYNFSIKNNEYQAMIEVELAAMERDQLGLITPRVRQLGGEASRHPGQLIWTLFETPGDAFDGTAFFANTRAIGDSANIDNIIAGTGTSVSQIQADLASARAQMRLFQDDKGRPMNILPNVIVCPAGLEQPIYQALNFEQGSGLVNAIPPATINGSWRAGGYTVYVNPFLTDADDWYVLRVSGEDKPFIWQVEKSPALAGSTNPNETRVIETRKALYSVNGRYAVGVTDPRFAVKVTN